MRLIDPTDVAKASVHARKRMRRASCNLRAERVKCLYFQIQATRTRASW